MRLLIVGLLGLVVGCGPLAYPNIDADDKVGEQTNHARKHMSDRGFSAENVGEKISTADDRTGEQANYARKHLSDRGVSSEQLKDLGVLTAEDAREYLYQRGLCEMRHGDNCGGQPKDGVNGKDGSDGQTGPSGSNGVDGKDGRDGADGLAGATGAKGDSGEAGPQGEKGETGETGDVGPKGDQGDQGVAGADGQKGDKGDPGESIVGPQGPQGLPGVDGKDAIIEVIDPCGDKPGHVDEVLFRLSNGDIAAWYEDVGLVILEKNVKYKTTDKQECKFKISNAGAVVGW